MVYDLVILGAGAAGMTASIYASRYKINHLIFGAKIGGQFVDAHIIENYPGFTSITGADLAEKFKQHVASYGINIREEKIGGIKVVAPTASVEGDYERVAFGKGSRRAPAVRPLADDAVGREGRTTGPTHPDNLNSTEPLFELSTEGGENVQTRSLILAMGAQHRALNIPGEQNFLGRGVSYCSTCDAPLFRGKTVAVVGGGNSALTAALHLSEFAAKVYLIHRRDKFDKAEPVWLEALEKKHNIAKVYNTQVKEIFGAEGPKNSVISDQSLVTRAGTGRTDAAKDSGEAREVKAAGVLTATYDTVKGVVLSQPYEGSNTLDLDGVFVEIGLMPAASLANQIGVTVDPMGYITTKGDLSTNVAGIFAAGDLVKQSDVPQLRQMITSAGQGAVAATSVYSFLNKKAPAPDWG